MHRSRRPWRLSRAANTCCRAAAAPGHRSSDSGNSRSRWRSPGACGRTGSPPTPTRLPRARAPGPNFLPGSIRTRRGSGRCRRPARRRCGRRSACHEFPGLNDSIRLVGRPRRAPCPTTPTPEAAECSRRRPVATRGQPLRGPGGPDYLHTPGPEGRPTDPCSGAAVAEGHVEIRPVRSRRRAPTLR